ncbi:indole-3-glycerol-phosphate synthase [Streptomyces sp. NPDC058661]|uniref:indole-3-glycerol phosphate synthase TrpC n=1 Tax=Streptomyces sp. NPDC058661 TaxID=3346582 RepID=UPI003650CDD4
MLAELLEAAAEQTSERRVITPLAELERMAASMPPPRRLAGALRAPGLGVIAELKPRSPIAGALTENYDPVSRARQYTAGGASALSVLTHTAGFGGCPEDLATVRLASHLPIIRKDFITDEYQVTEARAFGADALLLIVSALSREKLGELLRVTWRWGMEAIVEVHTANEADIAVAAGARVIGVNHRDLRTFSLDLTLIERLLDRVGPDRVLVAESGIRSAQDAERLRISGADAVLVGEMLMRAGDPESAVRELAEITAPPRPRPWAAWRSPRAW